LLATLSDVTRVAILYAVDVGYLCDANCILILIVYSRSINPEVSTISRI
jgi:hypothetical protein